MTRVLSARCWRSRTNSSRRSASDRCTSRTAREPATSSPTYAMRWTPRSARSLATRNSIQSCWSTSPGSWTNSSRCTRPKCRVAGRRPAPCHRRGSPTRPGRPSAARRRCSVTPFHCARPSGSSRQVGDVGRRCLDILCCGRSGVVFSVNYTLYFYYYH